MGRRRGEIWYVDLTDSKGHEQRGRRPAIVLAVSHAGITTVVPLTSQSNALSFPHTHEIQMCSENGLASDSVALVFQIVSLARERFINSPIGACSDEDMDAICIILKDMLSIP
ncbi:MAG: type II toxin-antitoxin system PemK/MazF family toxin [Methanomicrobiales archaeon]|nr:type II toxin-antitoxin system PemK/MazF family toxin [Methanomicrobiales archaeon]